MLTVIKRGQFHSRLPIAECTLLLGGFDGIHVGHQTLIEAAKKYGAPLAITSISGGKAGGDVFTFAERERVYESLGIEYVYEIVFSEELKNLSPQDFLDELFAIFSVKAIVCGSDFRFGKGAVGTPDFLAEYASCPVEAHELKKIGGEKVSSTNVKKLLSEGGMSEVNELLASPYFIHGTVEHGRHVGHSLGFPTVNLSFPTEKYLIREGVYGGYVCVYTQEGVQTYPTIVNFGSRPTFAVAERKVEAYLDGFDGDLYGKQVSIYPTEFYRPVITFSSADALRVQLREDIARLRATKEAFHD